MSELARLRWLCRRGMKELDIVMSRYLEHHYAEASEEERAGFRTLLEMPDPELYRLLLGQDEPAQADLAGLVRFLRRMSVNRDRDA